jgi:hypothetical protein
LAVVGLVLINVEPFISSYFYSVSEFLCLYTLLLLFVSVQPIMGHLLPTTPSYLPIHTNEFEVYTSHVFSVCPFCDLFVEHKHIIYPSTLTPLTPNRVDITYYDHYNFTYFIRQNDIIIISISN